MNMLALTPFPHSLRGFDRALEDTKPQGFADLAGHLGERVWRCDGCDLVRSYQHRFCADCNDVTGAYAGREFGTLERYFNDPIYRQECEIDRREGQARIDALFAGHDAAVRAKQEARWTAEAAFEREAG